MAEEPTCVYQYFDTSGALLYVGITGRGLKRSHEHARSKDWWLATSGCSIEHYASRDEALEREAYLIAAYKPPNNTQGKGRSVTSVRLIPAAEAITVDEQVAMGETFNRIADAKAGGDYKLAIRLWMELPRKYKSIHGCVACRERPGCAGPMCKPCHNAYVGGNTIQMRRERAQRTA